MPELADIINDLPPELASDGSTVDDTTDPVVDDPNTEDVEDTEEDDQNMDDDANADEDAEDEEDDYFTDADDEEDKPGGANDPAPGVTDEGQYILTNLPKIAVNVVMPKADGSEGNEVRQVQVYGFGDLPKNMLGFVSEYERGIFIMNANNNETKARELQSEFRQNKTKVETDLYVKKENKMIADDLTDLRKEGIFPKFKGVPGSEEFTQSPGGKEFDRVVAYMDQKNAEYGRAAQQGRAFKHIGFREAFEMLNGPNLKKAQQQDTASRRAAAAKLKGSRGTKSDTKVVSTKRVNNINELADEFATFAGGAA